MGLIKQTLAKRLAYLSKAVVHVEGEIRTIPHALFFASKENRVAIYAPSWFHQHFRIEAVWRRAYALSLMRRGIPFETVSRTGAVRSGQLVVWRPSEGLFPHDQFSDRLSAQLVDMAEQIETLGGMLFPDSATISCYENKINMHSMFETRGICSPHTFIVENRDEYRETARTLGLPFIIKGAFGFSSLQIHLVDTPLQAESFEKQIFSTQPGEAAARDLVPPVLVQEFLDIRRDLRVVFVGDELILSYWRVNPSSTWAPTATRYGSQVVFDSVPEQWQNEIVDLARRTQFPWGAFDLAWMDDNLSQPPYVLEVSPCFDPNPPPPPSYGMDYHRFKYGWSVRHNWDYAFWKTIQRVADAQIAFMLAMPQNDAGQASIS